MELWELMARESIRDLVARYNANGDTGRFDHVMELFAEDAAMDVEGMGLKTGLDEIRTVFTGARDGAIYGEHPVYVRHMTSTLQIDLVDEKRARGRCYYYVITDVGLDHWGRYIDEYETVDDTWRFAHRKITVDGRNPESLFLPKP
jgi:hypothetical protein